ncbi:hypothetical protein H310_11879 [Aphanomyces invadans]|uniref:C3H1-type domain-containing protein n=1 Tax=Aphanomyces invadans TaxID=157072 RepID=A0A024TMN3_9STRA|nr:hypothetical protein H310_11879 [Aphanomyces invadans]ETV94617.1 hypothetical protein H310_11879 [Aphanomyces invadans]|eukprot:XP_008876932.1 hypothetical protein H310_11879 [Aphanomyces invadans]
MSGWKGEEELKGALASLASAKGVSANRIKAACTTCMKWSKEYKRVVHAVEMAMWKSDVEHRLAYMYLIDALIRASQTKYGDEKDHFAKRFGQHLHHTLAACRKAPDDHKANVKRVVAEWQKRGVYTTQEIEQAGGADFLGDGPLNAPPAPNDEKIASLLSGLQKLKQQEKQEAPPGFHSEERPTFDHTRRPSPPRHHDVMPTSAYRERSSAPPSLMHAEPRYGDSAPPNAPSRFDSAPTPRYAVTPPVSSRYDHPPPSSRFDQHAATTSRFDQVPPQGSSRFDPPQGSSRFNETSHQGNPPYDQPPRQGAARFESSRPAPSRFDQPPQGPNGRFDPPFSRFDQQQSSYNGPPPQRHREYGYPRGPSPGRSSPPQDTFKRMRSRSRSRSPAKRQLLPCRDFPMGRCSRGNNCRYAHDGDGPTHGKPAQVKTRLCNTYPTCRFGDRCTFAHGERELGTSAYSHDDTFSQPRHTSPDRRFQSFQQAPPPLHAAPGGMHVTNTLPPSSTNSAPPYAPGTNDPPPPTRQRRSRWEDKKTTPAPTAAQDHPQTKHVAQMNDPPHRKIDVDDEHADDTAAAPEFTLEYDDDN